MTSFFIGLSKRWFKLSSKARSCNSFLHQPDVIHHANTSIEDFEYFIDLHPAGTVAIVEDCIADHDAAFRIDEANANLGHRAPGFRPEVALIAANVTALLNAIPRIVRHSVSTVVAIAARVIVGLDGLMVRQTFEVGVDDALQLRAVGALFR